MRPVEKPPGVPASTAVFLGLVILLFGGVLGGVGVYIGAVTPAVRDRDAAREAERQAEQRARDLETKDRRRAFEVEKEIRDIRQGIEQHGKKNAELSDELAKKIVEIRFLKEENEELRKKVKKD